MYLLVIILIGRTQKKNCPRRSRKSKSSDQAAGGRTVWSLALGLRSIYPELSSWLGANIAIFANKKNDPSCSTAMITSLHDKTQVSKKTTLKPFKTCSINYVTLSWLHDEREKQFLQ